MKIQEPGRRRAGRNEERQALLVAELLAFRGQLDQAAKIMVEHGAAQMAVDMFTEVHKYAS